VFVRDFLRKLFIYGDFVNNVQSFVNYAIFFWIVRLDAIWGRLYKKTWTMVIYQMAALKQKIPTFSDPDD